MDALFKLRAEKKSLQDEYKKLIEEAYNWRETDSALSDLSEFKAFKLMEQLNKLNYLDGEFSLS